MPILIGKLIDMEVNVDIDYQGEGASGSYKGTTLTIKSKSKDGKDKTETKGISQKFINSNPQILQDLMALVTEDLSKKPTIKITMKQQSTPKGNRNSIVRVQLAPGEAIGFFYTEEEKAGMNAAREEERGKLIAEQKAQADRQGKTPEERAEILAKYKALLGDDDAKSV